MKFIKYSGLVMACLLAVGCATTGENNNVPVVDADEVPVDAGTAEQSPEFKIIRNVPPVPPQNNVAVKVLLSEAEQYFRAQDYAGASGSLERAIRITPRDAGLYYRLAYVRFAQENYTQTDELCKKAISLSASYPDVQTACVALISRAKQASEG